jgi:hypothetical protein
MKKWLVVLILLMPFLLLAQTDSLKVSWDRNPETDMLHYLLDRSINSVTAFTTIANVPQPLIGSTPGYNDRPTPPLQGNLYSYRVVAVDSAGNYSEFSDTVSVGIPLITEGVVPANLTNVVTIPLDNIFSDPDNIQTELIKVFSAQTNCTVAVVSTNLVITPPTNFLGNGSFVATLTDPEGFWDEKTINFTIDTRDLTPPTKPTNVTITP